MLMMTNGCEFLYNLRMDQTHPVVEGLDFFSPTPNFEEGEKE
jgi:hypothetical protein